MQIWIQNYIFSFFNFNDILKEIERLNPRKATPSTTTIAKVLDIPVKLLQNNTNFFSNYICGFFDDTTVCCQFLSVFKQSNITLVFIKSVWGYKKMIVLLVYFQWSPRVIKNWFTSNLPLSRDNFYQLSSVVSERNAVLKYWECSM